jgi:DnaA family protein
LAADSLQVAPDTLIIADDVSALDGMRQTLLFRLFNSAHLAGLAFLLADRTPPAQLAMRDDLRTRLGQALIFHLAPLTDVERADALRRHALIRGMRLDDSLIQYLLRHARRDLPALMQILDELDRASLELKRQPSLPLLRDLLQSPIDLD